MYRCWRCTARMQSERLRLRPEYLGRDSRPEQRCALLVAVVGEKTVPFGLDIRELRVDDRGKATELSDATPEGDHLGDECWAVLWLPVAVSPAVVPVRAAGHLEAHAAKFSEDARAATTPTSPAQTAPRTLPVPRAPQLGLRGGAGVGVHIEDVTTGQG